MTVFVDSTLAERFKQQYADYETFQTKVLKPSINSIPENEYMNDKAKIKVNGFSILVTRVYIEEVEGIKLYNYYLQTLDDKL